MLEQLTAQHALKQRALEAVRNPLATVFQMAQRIHAKARDAVAEVKETKLYIGHGIDRLATLNWLQSVIFLPEPQRREAFRQLFQEALDQDFEKMYNLIKVLGGTDILQIAEKHRGTNPFTEEDMLLPLQIDHELFTEAVQTAQKHPKFKEWMEFVEAKAAKQNGQNPDELDELNLDGAALPEMFPKIAEYEDRIDRHVKGRGGKKGNSFGTLTRTFKHMSQRLYGEDAVASLEPEDQSSKEAFYGVGTLPTFKSLVLRFWDEDHYPNAHLIASPYEYFPMYYQVSKSKRHLADVPNGLVFTENELVEAMLKKGREIMVKREDGPDAETDPIILLISSQLRIGGKMLDTAKIAALVEAENATIGYKQYDIWFDASQDSRVIKQGDIVLHSKRHGGTGGGMVIASAETYPEDAADIREAFRTRSGYNSRYIPRMIASMFSIDKKIGHSFSSLIDPKTSSLWYYKGGGGFLQAEINRAQEVLQASPDLKELFTMTASLPDADSGQWRIDTIARLELTEEGQKRGIDMKRLRGDLAELNVSLTYFNLEHCDTNHGRPGFKKLMRFFNTEPFDLASFIKAVETFQKFYSQEMVMSLLPQENREDPEYVREYFQKAVAQHDYFRIFVTAIDRKDTIKDFIKRLELAVQKQLPTPTSS